MYISSSVQQNNSELSEENVKHFMSLSTLKCYISYY